jgi:hypothetical protein
LDDGFQQMDLPASTDMSGWDWTVKFWMLWSAATLRALSGGAEEVPGGSEDTYSSKEWNTMFHKRALLVALAVIVFSDGEAWAQTIPGVQKSGLYVTSADNSKMRALLVYCLCLLLGIPVPTWLRVCTMGDDCVEDLVHIAEATGKSGKELCELVTKLYGQLGVDVKDIALGRPVEFCGYYFHGFSEYEPVRWTKIAATFFRNWPRPEAWKDRVFALEYELRHSPHKQRVLDLVEQVRSIL